nr:hypothetical protein [Tanacetum cinerariifolium]
RHPHRRPRPELPRPAAQLALPLPAPGGGPRRAARPPRCPASPAAPLEQGRRRNRPQAPRGGVAHAGPEPGHPAARHLSPAQQLGRLCAHAGTAGLLLLRGLAAGGAARGPLVWHHAAAVSGFVDGPGPAQRPRRGAGLAAPGLAFCAHAQAGGGQRGRLPRPPGRPAATGAGRAHGLLRGGAGGRLLLRQLRLAAVSPAAGGGLW